MNNDNVIEKRAGFTPGPWQKSEGEIYRGNDPICDIIYYAGSEVDEANASLIASAPELYEQCKLFERVLAGGDLSATHDGLRNCDMLAQLREVLAKADGRAEG